MTDNTAVGTLAGRLGSTRFALARLNAATELLFDELRTASAEDQEWIAEIFHELADADPAAENCARELLETRPVWSISKC